MFAIDKTVFNSHTKLFLTHIQNKDYTATLFIVTYKFIFLLSWDYYSS